MNYLCTHSLSSILAILALAGLVISLFNLDEVKARYTSLVASLLVLGITIKQYTCLFDPSIKELQMVESYKWVGPINFSLGVDGLAYSMVLLMAILLPCAVIASKPIAQKQKPRLYYSLLMFLSLAVMAVFMAKDIFLFFLAWELELVPMYLLIAIWGSKNRNYASMKFMLYTFAAGILLLIGLFILLMNTGFATFDMVSCSSDPISNFYFGRTLFYYQASFSPAPYLASRRSRRSANSCFDVTCWNLTKDGLLWSG